jgi:hypothetical protein
VSNRLQPLSASRPRAVTAVLIATLLQCVCVAAPAPALAASQAAVRRARPLPAHSVKLTATLSPKRLGAQTTIRVGFQVSTPAGRAPSPVTEVGLLLPRGLAIATSDLGLETCEPAKLEREGLSGCPADSLMGRGSAAAEVPFGSGFVTEQAPVSLFSAPLRDGHPQLLFAAEGEYPVLASIVFAALLLPAHAPFGGALTAALPLVPSVRDGPDLALVRLQTTIGAKGIVYTEAVKGKTISFRPRGIVLPQRCPRGGFRFAAQLSFQDGTHATATTAVPCPRRN